MPLSAKEIEEAAAAFQWSPEEESQANQLHQEFLQLYPRERIPSLTLDEYALGKGKGACWHLEFGAEKLGRIRGATAFKHVVFFDTKLNQWRHNKKYASEIEAFEAVKSGLLRMFELVEQGRFAEIDGVPPFENQNLTRGKWLYMYFPEQFVPIFSPAHLSEFSQAFGLAPRVPPSPTLLNRSLLEYRQSSRLFSAWSNLRFMRFLYARLPPVRFWKIAPGENAEFWEECRAGGYICIGWDALGDLTQYNDRPSLLKAFVRTQPKDNRNKVSEVWRFRHLEEGDLIVANRGMKSIVGLGRVKGPYFFNAERSVLRHCVPVDWFRTDEYPIADRKAVSDWWARTVKRLTQQEYESLSGAVPPPPPEPNGHGFETLRAETSLPTSFFEDCEKLLKSKRQFILQGAPGTGKTYVATKLAHWWAGQSGRVVSVQFHESYGYEDFVHGIRPRHDDNSGNARFVAEDGVFLRFCETARRSAARHVLIIDEINRAKTARVFGELLWLLEYRDETITLQYGQEFSIPPNVYIIGTMNTIDRSIALVDYALRRRFAFVTLWPVRDGKSVVLNAWLKSHGIGNAEEIDRLFVALNTAIAEKEEALMLGHSYFMVEDARKAGRFDDDLLDFIWRTQILPLVAEYEYQLSSSQIEEKYGLPAIRKRAGLLSSAEAA